MFFLVNPNDDCPPAIPIPHGSVEVLLESRGSVSLYTCNDGFALRGSSRIGCNLQENMWPLEDIPECGKCGETAMQTVRMAS